MSTSRHIDRICVIAVVLTLIVTVLFMNGRALGIEAVPDGDDGDGQFTANDLDGSWDASSAALNLASCPLSTTGFSTSASSLGCSIPSNHWQMPGRFGTAPS